MTTQLGEKNVKARKAHCCQICALNISAGVVHYTQRNADGSSVWTWRAHLECNAKLFAYLKWCGIDPPWDEEDFDVDPFEFRRFLASHKADYDG